MSCAMLVALVGMLLACSVLRGEGGVNPISNCPQLPLHTPANVRDLQPNVRLLFRFLLCTNASPSLFAKEHQSGHVARYGLHSSHHTE